MVDALVDAMFLEDYFEIVFDSFTETLSEDKCLLKRAAQFIFHNIAEHFSNYIKTTQKSVQKKQNCFKKIIDVELVRQLYIMNVEMLEIKKTALKYADDVYKDENDKRAEIKNKILEEILRAETFMLQRYKKRRQIFDVHLKSIEKVTGEIGKTKVVAHRDICMTVAEYKIQQGVDSLFEDARFETIYVRSMIESSNPGIPYEEKKELTMEYIQTVIMDKWIDQMDSMIQAMFNMENSCFEINYTVQKYQVEKIRQHFANTKRIRIFYATLMAETQNLQVAIEKIFHSL